MNDVVCVHFMQLALQMQTMLTEINIYIAGIQTHGAENVYSQ